MVNLVNLTNNPADDDRAPSWSPDGTKIAFARNNDVVVMDADGSNLTNLTNSPEALDGQPSFAPDGTKIAFARTQPDSTAPPGIFTKRDIVVINVNGSNPTNLSNNSGGKVSDVSYRSWAPDGTKIAFSSFRQAFPPSGDIHVVGTDGSNSTNLTGGSPVEGIATSNPATWSPDGSRIAFFGIEGGGINDLEIFVISIDGSDLTDLTRTQPIDNQGPSWSPDGTKIAFARRGDIFVKSIDGSDLTNLTKTQRMDNQGPTWSPDGSKIAFSRSEAGGNRDINRIFVMDADGSNPTNLTDALPDGGIGVDFELTWSPDGTKIAFSSAPNAPNSTNKDIFTLEVTPAEE